jgi:hypothetical protein
MGDHAPVALTTVLVVSLPRLPRHPVAVAHGHDLARALAPLDALDRAADPHLGPALDGVDGVGDAEPSAVDAPLVERHGPTISAWMPARGGGPRRGVRRAWGFPRL